MTTNATRLLTLLSKHFGVLLTEAATPLDMKLLAELKPDSLDVVELIMAIEDEFEIVIDDDEAMGLGEQATLRDLLALVEGKLPQAALPAVIDGPNGPELGEIVAGQGVE